MLDQSADEPLHRANEHAVQHGWPMWGVVGTRVFETEALRKIEVELHRRTLPFPPDRVDQLEVELRSVKSAPAFIVSE